MFILSNKRRRDKGIRRSYHYDMLAISLQSGSNGNCIYVEADGACLLLDAGISGVQAERRLAEFGRDIRRCDALIISHDHRDHVRAAGIYQRKYGLPVYITRPTLAEAEARCGLGELSEVRHFAPGDVLEFGAASVETVPTPHDGADGVGFVIHASGARLGVLTDLGHPFKELAETIASLDAVILESNYDPHMLEAGPYPAFLKARIRGLGGHLSNIEAAELLASVGGKLQWACLAHLSEHNNTPKLALRTHREILQRRLPLYVATRYEPSDVLRL